MKLGRFFTSTRSGVARLCFEITIAFGQITSGFHPAFGVTFNGTLGALKT